MLMIILSAVLVVIMVYLGSSYLMKKRQTGVRGMAGKRIVIPELVRLRSRIMAIRKGTAGSQSPSLTKPIEVPRK